MIIYKNQVVSENNTEIVVFCWLTNYFSDDSNSTNKDSVVDIIYRRKILYDH
jgi:hypothetical protein